MWITADCRALLVLSRRVATREQLSGAASVVGRIRKRRNDARVLQADRIADVEHICRDRLADDLVAGQGVRGERADARDDPVRRIDHRHAALLVVPQVDADDRPVRRAGAVAPLADQDGPCAAKVHQMAVGPMGMIRGRARFVRHDAPDRAEQAQVPVSISPSYSTTMGMGGSPFNSINDAWSASLFILRTELSGNRSRCVRSELCNKSAGVQTGDTINNLCWRNACSHSIGKGHASCAG